MTIKPIHDRVVIKRLEEESTTSGGIIIPEVAKEKPIQGEVRAAGGGRWMEGGQRLPMQVKPGDRVLFSRYAGNEIKVDGEELLIMREDDILAVIEG
jgi:chaperonin GroES